MRSAGVRLRMTVGATAVVGIALVLGGLLLLGLLRTSLTNSAERAASVRAEELVALLGRDLGPGDLPLESDRTGFVQVLDADGVVVAASQDVTGRPALATRLGTTTLDPGPIDDGEAFVAVARTVPGGGTVVAGRTLETVGDATEVLAIALAVGIPLLCALVALTAWVLTGRALQPVEAVRREVASISAAELARRVPVPPGDDEVARLAVTMNAMLDRLERAHVVQRRFLADASHELRSPLAALRSQLEVALADPSRTSVDELGGDLLDQTTRLAGLVEDLLLLAGSDEGATGPAARPVDLDDLVLAEAARLRDGRLRVDASAVGAARVNGHPAALARLVRNLVDNAERHALSQVVLSLRAYGGQALLEVGDDGDGVAAEDRERVFERFARLDAARSRYAGGSGLGLAIVREVARAHGGEARAVDGGFTVVLPLA